MSEPRAQGRSRRSTSSRTLSKKKSKAVASKKKGGGASPRIKGKAASTKRVASSASFQTFVPEQGSLPQGAAAYLRKRAPQDTAGLGKEQLLEIYRCLFETRRLEEHVVALYRQNKVVGGVYRSLGQEGTAVGCAYALKNGDFLQPLIRDLGAALVHGTTPLSILRQYMARSTGPSGGRDLNMHFSDPKVGLLGPVSMLGAMVPVLAGCLLAARQKGERKAGLCLIGDGGSSTGAFYEGLNFAAVQKLPMIAVIEANHFAYSTPTSMQVPDGDLLRRAKGFGCTVAHADGNDVLACYQATREARKRGLEGEGPTVIVVDTYRRRGHAEHDNQAYVAPGEVEDWAKNNDPIDRYLDFLGKGKHASEKELTRVREEVEAQLNEARDQAVQEDFPTADTLLQGVYEDGSKPWPSSETWFRSGPRFREEA